MGTISPAPDTSVNPPPAVVAGEWSYSLLTVVEDTLDTKVVRVNADRLTRDPAVAPELFGAHDHPWLLLGAGLPEAEAREIADTAYATAPSLRLVVLGPIRDETRASRWLRRGCDVYLADIVTPGRLAATLELAVLDRVVVFDQRCRERGSEQRDALCDLSAREREILDLVCTGRGNSEIAKSLRLSRRTVEFHLTRIFGKLGVNSRLEAVTYVYGTLF